MRHSLRESRECSIPVGGLESLRCLRYPEGVLIACLGVVFLNRITCLDEPSDKKQNKNIGICMLLSYRFIMSLAGKHVQYRCGLLQCIHTA